MWLEKSNLYLGTAVLEAAVNTSVKWFINTGNLPLVIKGRMGEGKERNLNKPS